MELGDDLELDSVGTYSLALWRRLLDYWIPVSLVLSCYKLLF